MRESLSRVFCNFILHPPSLSSSKEPLLLGSKMSENSAMEVEEEIKEVKNSSKKRSNKEARDDRLMKGVLLSLTKPSYTLTKGSENLRTKNRARLRRLLSRLVRRHNWEEASGVLSVLLKGTCSERSVSKNRSKYWVTMELLKHIRGDYQEKYIKEESIKKIQHVYDIWMKRISSKNWSTEDRFMAQLEFILFYLREGKVEDACQQASSLRQHRESGSHCESGSEPLENMVLGLTFCQMWYSTISKELQIGDSDESYSPMKSEMEMRVEVPTENSEGHDTVDIYQVGSSLQADSVTSVRNDKEAARDVDVDQHREVSMEADDSLQKETTYQNHQSQGFYMNAAEDSGQEKSSFPNYGANMQYASTSNVHGLDSWLLPFRLSDDANKNDNYKNAVEHLRLALYSTAPIYEALLPLVQMLLLGDRVDDALKELDNFGQKSETALPLRAKASLLENFDSTNNVKLSTSFEDILKKDPTCSHSLAKLMSMHQNGGYSPQQLLEMIALHLDATYAEGNTWKEFASCFLKLHSCEEDRMSTCLNGNGGVNKQGIRFNKILNVFTDGISRKTWTIRCRWWLTRHFSQYTLKSEMETGDLQLVAYKAASASHMYGPEFEYVVKANECLKDKDRDLFLFLQVHMQNSVGFYYSDFDKK